VIFTPAPLPGVFVVDAEPSADARGLFARTFCADEFRSRGLHADFPQCSTSYNAKAGTLRGLHWQAAPHEEVKLVRATRGAVFDVAVDLRPGSNTRLQWFGVELSADNRRALYIPGGFAHGFQSLSDDAEVYYQISTRHQAGSARGARWNDPAFGIRWPESAARILSDRDRSYPDFR
jgi:dTDP-4-dehydrorhamnose 3,5-epimerase